MRKDEDTAYDEVIKEIGDIGMSYIKQPQIKAEFMKHINQLMRLLNDEEIYSKEDIRFVNDMEGER